MNIEVLNEVDAIYQELNESIEINYAIEESRGHTARKSQMGNRNLSAEEEKNERFAEAVAKMAMGNGFGFKYEDNISLNDIFNCSIIPLKPSMVL